MEESFSKLSIEETSLATMRQAVDNFRNKMRSSNIKFLQDQADEIEQKDVPEEKKIEYFSRFFNEVPDFTADRVISQMPTLQAAREEMLLHDNWLNGVDPPFGGAESSLKYVRMLTDMANEIYGSQDEEISAPTELLAFLQFANGVFDPDFRGDTVAHWVPGFELGHDCDESDFKTVIRHRLVDPKEIADKSCLEIKCGIWTGEQSRFEESSWSYYIYCRPKENCCRWSSQPGWRWRVLFSGTREWLDEDLWDSIPEFLDWYGSWTSRLSLERVHNLYFGGSMYGGPDEWFPNEDEKEEEDEA